MAVNQVKLKSGRTLIDISDSTVTASDLPLDVVAYNSAGERIVGVANYAKESDLNALATRVTDLEAIPPGYNSVTTVAATMTSGTAYSTTLADYDSSKSEVQAFVNGLLLGSSEYSITDAGVFTMAKALTGNANTIIIKHWRKS